MSEDLRVLGGESGHRSFFGRTHSRPRIVGLAFFFIVGLFGVMNFGFIGLLVGVLGCGIVLALTTSTHHGTALERRTDRIRIKERIKDGTDKFEPYTPEAWEAAQAEAGKVKGAKEKARILNAVRERPDGADGMGWLQKSARTPGIAWHAPSGEDAYLSVVFSVSGQLRGIESAESARASQIAFGKLLASRAPASTLAKKIMPMTRVLPPDLAFQEQWMMNNLAPDALPDAVKSYEEVLALTAAGTLIQKHYVTVAWPLTPEFKLAAARKGPGRDGWRSLMDEEIASMTRALRKTRFREVEPLTARATAAIILHQQNPSRPIEMVADVDPTRLGIRSHDEKSAHVVHGVDPVSGERVQWWHRTAKITAENVITSPRTQYWVFALLMGAAVNSVRTVAFHHELVPAAEARHAAKQDLVRDLSDEASLTQAGKIADSSGRVKKGSSKRRVDDLEEGSQHHGDNWIGFVTLSAKTREGLAESCRQLTDACTTDAGVNRLVWLDSYQSAASGTTWPIVRGLKPARKSFGSKMMDRLAGNGDKDAIS
ncbi:hypothetical protein [Arthrobacter sp. MMS18-M83]|uniref:hypothetical protein n=1 Tax=Arthrobacter sp. MMS18-M83 TaxID=2996261 RepID=UPI00227AEE2C|nr:hypothetical protein [Arthrobacter sp. MMS18-M83]WAH99753.1 hypothetical protein OW521_23890 [Arthrobacter sp. MMS18-M83]